MEANQIPENYPDALDDAYRAFLQNVHLKTVSLYDYRGRLDLTGAIEATRKLSRDYGEDLKKWAGNPGYVMFAATPEAYDRHQQRRINEILGHTALD